MEERTTDRNLHDTGINVIWIFTDFYLILNLLPEIKTGL